jgi:hypothetical protein
LQQREPAESQGDDVIGADEKAFRKGHRAALETIADRKPMRKGRLSAGIPDVLRHRTAGPHRRARSDLPDFFGPLMTREWRQL